MARWAIATMLRASSPPIKPTTTWRPPLRSAATPRLAVAVTPTKSIAPATPPPESFCTCFAASGARVSTVARAPSRMASWSFAGSMSQATIGAALMTERIAMPISPRPPQPITATQSSAATQVEVALPEVQVGVAHAASHHPHQHLRALRPRRLAQRLLQRLAVLDDVVAQHRRFAAARPLRFCGARKRIVYVPENVIERLETD